MLIEGSLDWNNDVGEVKEKFEEEFPSMEIFLNMVPSSGALGRRPEKDSSPGWDEEGMKAGTLLILEEAPTPLNETLE